VLQIAIYDTLGLDNTVARNRLLIAAAGTAARLNEAEPLVAMATADRLHRTVRLRQR
jgi:hypothetical protein